MKNPSILVTLFLLICIKTSFSQGNVTLKINGNDKLILEENNIGDLRFQIDPSSLNSDNLFIGTSTGINISNSASFDGFYNTGVGNYSLSGNTTGQSNSAFGQNSLLSNTTGGLNTSIGGSAMSKNVDGNENVAFGASALGNNQSGNQNVAIGTQAGFSALGNQNVFIGYKSGYSETGANKLYIDNKARPMDSVLIYGEFDNNYLRMNANVEAYSFSTTNRAVSGIQQYPSGSSDVAGVYGENTVSNGWGVGVQGVGNYRGVVGESLSIGVAGIGQTQGVRGDATGTSGSTFGVGGNAVGVNSAGSNYGVYGRAQNGGSNYSIYGENSGSGINDWAGYFNGKINVQGNLVSNGVITANDKINVSSSGMEFPNGEVINNAVGIKYIIATGGTFPNNGGGNSQYDVTLLGEVKMFAGQFAPPGWAFCNGQQLSIVSNPELFSLLGINYGGDGQSTFGLPNFNNAPAIHK